MDIPGVKLGEEGGVGMLGFVQQDMQSCRMNK